MNIKNPAIRYSPYSKYIFVFLNYLSEIKIQVDLNIQATKRGCPKTLELSHPELVSGSHLSDRQTLKYPEISGQGDASCGF
ncbi:MAG: hypothetical protein A2W90_05725 [Bacteroidetes bacterium GWF2_42_66]|nr:MAG: hypothetical protein A2W92_01105 [Bacteroidetes bacterium GWA2_42_15]OFY03543.1 MAG: hypothetical protein A2W89_18450 [Bacteroidetes bacterium GWE2_42_39]OFY45908.1 MAG: hypothetical protein A2W90_05725 [Bacteroidetes bacterium GWF2_42_66]HCU59610.1 hypothetical protein [Prolixibacteraceae bacterium]